MEDIYRFSDGVKMKKTSKSLTQRLYDSGAQFSGQIIEQASPILTFLLTWILPIAIFIGIGQYMSKKLMERAFSQMELTARGYHRILRTARTIADLDGEERIRENHLREALSLRMIDEKYWRR